MAKYYYNGVLLPEIPADVLASYPYSYLQKNKSSGDLRFVCAKSAVYYSSTYNNLVIPEGGRCSCKLSADGTEWVVVGTYEDSVNIFLSYNELLWSNHNIRNGSADATKIYFYGSEPVPESGEVEPEDILYSIHGSTLTAIAEEVRRITGTTNKMTTAQIVTALQGIATPTTE